MKLLLNTESLRPPLTGIGNYTLNLLNELLKLEGIEHIECLNGQQLCSPEARLAQYHDAAEQHVRGTTAGPAQTAPQGGLRSLLRRVPLAYRAREALRNLHLRQMRQKYRDFVYHEPNFILKEHAGPCITTIHDLSFIRYPQFHPAERVAWMTRELPKTLKRADMILTDSDIVRNELLESFDLEATKVRTVYLGAADCYHPRQAEETQKRLLRHGLQHDQYCLFVGTLEPRKGLDTLLDAWLQVPLELRKAFPLVLAGAPGWHNRELLQRIETLAASGELYSLQFVPADELPILYAGARLFIYPSQYEGFGLPVLEAMSCGVPVICTADTSMAEFSAEACLLFERSNAEELAMRIIQVLESPERHDALAEAALRRAGSFSWRRCAEETLQTYRLCAESSLL